MSLHCDFLLFPTAVTLKIRPRSPNLISVLLCPIDIGEYLVRIQPLQDSSQDIVQTLESVTPMPTATGSTPKTICPPPRRWGGHKKKSCF